VFELFREPAASGPEATKLLIHFGRGHNRVRGISKPRAKAGAVRNVDALFLSLGLASDRGERTVPESDRGDDLFTAIELGNPGKRLLVHDTNLTHAPFVSSACLVFVSFSE
jgi:hypothetical protein